MRPGRDCLSRCEFPSSSRLTSAHMCAAFAAPVAMKCEIDARRGYRLRHRSRYIGHIQSLCDSRGLACGPMRFTANTRPDMRPGTVGRNDISAVLLSPNSADRLVDAEANSRRTSRQAAYCDRPLRRGATAGSGRPLSNQLSPWHFRFTRGRGAGAVERLCIVGAQHELCAHISNVPTCACDRSFWSATVNDVLIANQDCHGRAANEVQVCRFREIARVSCTEVTRWRPMLRSGESTR